MQPVNVIEVGQLASGHIGSEVIGRNPSVGGNQTREGLHPGTSDAGNALGVLYLLPGNAGREYDAAVGGRIQRGITAAKLHGRSTLNEDDGGEVPTAEVFVAHLAASQERLPLAEGKVVAAAGMEDVADVVGTRPITELEVAIGEV